MTKKVVLVLVEGETEETVLAEYLDEVFDNQEVFIDVQKGDILADWNQDKNVKIVIGDVIKAYLKKTKFRASDLKWVFQITDSDGAFIPNDDVKVDEQKTLFYDESAIFVSDAHKKSQIEKRNEKKAHNMTILSTTNYFNLDRVKVPYKIYYFSTNLDHVLWDERNELKHVKTRKADEFIDNLEGTLEQFLWNFSAITQEQLTDQSYKESWTYLSEELNSLKRLTNVTLLFELARDQEIKE